VTLHVRWLGRVRYGDAYALQKALFAGSNDHLLLLEHPPTYTLGVRASMDNVLIDPASVGAELIRTDRGGDVTYHAPGQLVGYPILTVAGKRGTTTAAGGMSDTVAYVCGIEQLLIDVCGDLGLANVGRLRGFPGVWVDPDSPAPRKIAAVGVKLSRGRSMHGFQLNVAQQATTWAQHIVPCGLVGRKVTSLEQEGLPATMRQVVDAVVARAGVRWAADGSITRADATWREVPEDLAPFSRGEGAGAVPMPLRGREAPPQPKAGGTSVRLLGRLAQAGVNTAESVDIADRKPEWMRVKANMGPEYRRLKSVLRDLDLVTVCEEAGCPNIFDCWNDGTATFMVLGERCTRACGFCLVDTRHPLAPDPAEPNKVADAVKRLSLRHAVITMVARDDLADGGAAHVAQTVAAIRAMNPTTQIEVLVSDFKGDPASLEIVFAAGPDVFNHNTETVIRLQRAVRPSASYARSLSVLARAKAAGLTTKSGLIVGMGETPDEVKETLVDLRSVGVDIVTIGQYLRPTTSHLPIHRWWTPEEFDGLRAYGMGLGFAHVESSPLTRSSYHAREGAEAARA
jgi:lipoyl synthase